MTIRGEVEIRELLDPEAVLPPVTLRSAYGEDDAGITSYKAFQDSRDVGSITLRRSMPQIGLGTVKIEALRANAGDQTDHVRASIEIAILALSTVEQRVIVSDPYGETFERTAMWYRFAGAGVASILEPFTPRPALMMWQDGQGGEAIYDGQALAPPVSLPTARLHR